MVICSDLEGFGWVGKAVDLVEDDGPARGVGEEGLGIVEQ
jgi:hypothetical protein